MLPSKRSHFLWRMQTKIFSRSQLTASIRFVYWFVSFRSKVKLAVWSVLCECDMRCVDNVKFDYIFLSSFGKFAVTIKATQSVFVSSLKWINFILQLVSSSQSVSQSNTQVFQQKKKTGNNWISFETFGIKLWNSVSIYALGFQT